MSSFANQIITSQGFEYGVKHFLSQKNGNTLDIISTTLTLSEDQTLFLLQLGCVYINSKRVDNPAFTINTNDHIRVHTKPRRYQTHYDWKHLIAFDHVDFVVLNKPANLPSHPSVDNQLENSLTQLSLYLNQKLHVTHRLDSLTQGLIVYGKNTQFVNSFNKQLQNNHITKKYVALVETTKKLDHHLIHYMEKTPRAPKNVSPIFHEGWDLCELKIEEQKIFESYSWIKINLLTGRTHQIRSQCSNSEAPILGDTLYGSTFPFKNEQIALRAQEIEFVWLNQSHNIKLSEEFDLPLSN
ncbi:MAG: pseudouridine synthase [Pseudobdellovibrio sp.]